LPTADNDKHELVNFTMCHKGWLNVRHQTFEILEPTPVYKDQSGHNVKQAQVMTDKGGQPRLKLAPANLWKIALVAADRPSQHMGCVSARDCQAAMQSESTDSGMRLSWQITEPCQLEIRIDIDQQAACWQIQASITNHSQHAIVSSFAWVSLNLPTQGAALIFPQGAGRRVANFATLSIPPVQYPSYQCSMPWLAMDHADGGLYLGVHDPDDNATDVALSWDARAAQLGVTLTQFPHLQPGQQTQLPRLVCHCYEGHWSQASAFYRQWFDRVGPVAAAPAWLRSNSGWLLAILKQQNESQNYDYINGIDELADIALARGLDTLGLFGWTVGGHDHLYPHYDPDPGMGGREALKSAIRRAKDRGLRVILYSNGVIMDVATKFYREQGKDACTIGGDGRVDLSQINKFSDATPVVFATACPGARPWREAMLALAMQAYELGADGLLYDQIGVYGRHECHHPDHDHSTPMQGFSTAKVTMVRQIANHMKQFDENFVIATEAFIAPLARELHLIHGFGYAYGLPHDDVARDELFPDMMRLTFPEMVVTNRIPQPLFDRRVGHYAAMHGFRQELEIRYAEDVALSRGQALDWSASYKTAIGAPPCPQLLQQAIAADEKTYMARLLAFCKRHADVFYQGTYRSDTGFTLQSSALQARAFATAAGELGIVIWNPTDRDCHVELSVAGRELLDADAPEGMVSDALSALPPQSIRLLRYR
jgi:hypothetical protein